MNASDSKKTCPECGLEMLSGNSAFGCLGCSLRLALASDPGASEAASRPVPEGLKSRFFGDYEILGEVARGGMGVVYRARQLGISRVVALKMVQSHHLLSDEARLRFRVEIEAVAQLHHPHIVPLYESGEHEGAHYFTMRLLEGGDLAAHLKREAPLRDRIKLLVQVCHAVHYAHQCGILHRDLKPSNILLDEEGLPHVADFGLAKSLDQESGFTFTFSVLGSPNYMAPEQASGKCRQLTTAVDVYGLGAILYHMITGRPPFQADTPIATLRQVMDNDPQAPHLINSSVDRDLETIALKCLQKDPAARYGTAHELAQDLDRWLQGRPIRARPLGPLALGWRWSRRHPVAAVLSAGILLAVLVVFFGTGVAAVRIRKAERHAAEQLGQALVSEARALRIRGEWGNRGEGLRLLKEAAPLTVTPAARLRARNELLGLLTLPDLPFTSDRFTGAALDPALYRVDPSFEKAARADGTNIVVYDLGSGREIVRFASVAPITALERFSPDGRYLAVRHTNALTFWDAQNGRLCSKHSGKNVVFSFGHSPGELLVQSAPNEAVFLELASGRERHRWQVDPERPGGRLGGWHTVVLSPDSRVVAGASAVSQIVEMLDAQTGRALRLLTNSPRTTAMAWSPDGNRFAVATGRGRIYIWDMQQGALLWTSPILPGRAHSLAFHPDDAVLALACEDQRVRLLHFEEHRVVFESIANTPHITYSLAGRRLGPVRRAQSIGWFEPNHLGEYVEFNAGVSTARSSDCFFSGDGRLLAVGHPVSVAICDPHNGSLTQTLREFRISGFAFHPSTNLALVAHPSGLFGFNLRAESDKIMNLSDRTRMNSARGWRALDITPDGRRFAAYNGSNDMTLVFDHTLTNVVASFGPHPETEHVAINSDGRWVATGSYQDKSVRLWDVAHAELLKVFETGPRPQSAFSNDGKWFATFGDTFGLWRTETWKAAEALPVLEEDRPAWGAAAFSHDSRILAVVANLNAVHLLDLRSLEFLGILRPSPATRIRALAFSPDNAILAGVGSEGRVSIWHMDRIGKRLADFGLHWRQLSVAPD